MKTFVDPSDPRILLSIFRPKFRGVLGLVLLPLLAACGRAAGEAPRPFVPTSAPTSPGDFVVRPGDVLQVTVWPATELSGEYPIEDTGLVHLPGVGAVEVGDRSLREVRSELRARYGDALRSPIVTVSPRFRVSVLGAVGSPGLYHVDPTLSVFDVISVAGWFREDARPEDVRILRDGEVIELDAESALESGEFSHALQSGDRIVVPREWFRLGRLRDLTIAANFVGLLVGLAIRAF